MVAGQQWNSNRTIVSSVKDQGFESSRPWYQARERERIVEKGTTTPAGIFKVTMHLFRYDLKLALLSNIRPEINSDLVFENLILTSSNLNSNPRPTVFNITVT